MFYHSPLCIIKIKISGGYINELIYIDEEAESLPETAKLSGEDNRALKKCITQFDEYFSGKRKIFSLPVKQDGTIFQQKVWNELIKIPFGKTISYLQLARQLGDAKSIRAAASANGRNKLNIIVPCHRVIGSNGTLVGYGGGLPRKKWLLDHENKYAHGVSLLF
ncbi:methylated-DNA--[protein]-cysteine S-methyltransferase [Ginsengibacter hankyongi]|uniref:Methylated-DNA--protein-cysteine methyltransferase n=1 Tax=Ginsengibacter hankyongi TaxID=2607284 RepID=A0A5J5IFB3_9BACT|nr:methylated-DNA--[protein]-cysteine S-methyltransferase [Ginsengibacter hankyongi]KAA9038439.1 methylated-DNA--[protein]-cysteine S-methyltransferase [Ginsengibacter hankyongi]